MKELGRERAGEKIFGRLECWHGMREKAYLQRPTTSHNFAPELGDRMPSMLDGNLEAVVGTATFRSTCNKREWASAVHSFECILPAGRPLQRCCSKMMADLRSEQLAHSGCRGAHWMNRSPSRGPEWGTSRLRSSVLQGDGSERRTELSQDSGVLQ